MGEEGMMRIASYWTLLLFGASQ